MKPRLRWREIIEEYRGFWVELVDYDWDVDLTYPTSACVNRAARTRTELMQSLRDDDSGLEPVILFIGFTASVLEAQSATV